MNSADFFLWLKLHLGTFKMSDVIKMIVNTVVTNTLFTILCIASDVRIRNLKFKY